MLLFIVVRRRPFCCRCGRAATRLRELFLLLLSVAARCAVSRYSLALRAAALRKLNFCTSYE